MALPYGERRRWTIPPIGQGLAVVVTVAAISILSLGAVTGYLLSLHVAATSNEGKALDARLRDTRQDIRKLRLELVFRSRFVELERWSNALGLSTPNGRQYARSESQLASVAAARRATIAPQKAPCTDVSVNGCPRIVQGGTQGYTPAARKQLDGLIGDILK